MQDNKILIDYWKLLMAFFVLVLHANPFIDYSKTIAWGVRACITPVAVPFFLL